MSDTHERRKNLLRKMYKALDKQGHAIVDGDREAERQAVIELDKLSSEMRAMVEPERPTPTHECGECGFRLPAKGTCQNCKESRRASD